MKKLYFEGAGCRTEETGDVGNCRIRTAFLNNEGKAIYIELLQGANINADKCYIDFCHYITEDPKISDSNESTLKCERNQDIKIKYTKQDITRAINKYCNCSFDTIEVLPDYEGYNVHAGYKDGKYRSNLIDNHIVNIPRAEARKKAFNKIDEEYRKLLSSKYSVISLLELNEDNIVIRCHASKEAIKKAGLTEDDRVKIITVEY